LQQVFGSVVLVIVADQKPGKRGTGHICNTCVAAAGS
jgi:hypothetical protein